MEVTVAKLFKGFSGKPVLDGISFTASSGSILCLLGPSDAGKTTLIRLLLGAIAADSGSVTIEGRRVPDLEVLRDIGYMPQNDALYEDISGEDNLKFYGSLFQMDKRRKKERIDEVLDLLNLTQHRKKPVRYYSGGMKKRLSLATSLLNEPTVGIDPVLKRTVWDTFTAMKQKGITLIISTHVMDEVMECDNAALLYDGKLIHYGAVDALIASTDSGRVEELFFRAGGKGAR